MARSGRPVSESYQPVSCSVAESASYSIEAAATRPEDEDDRAPIFSLSKSSMDVVTATGSPHKRDPAWSQMDLKRSSSTNTHAGPNSPTFRKTHPRAWPHLQLPLTARNVRMHDPPAHGEPWLGGVQRWSACSDSTHSRSSTPDTVIWTAATSRPSSLTHEASGSAAPESPLSKVASPSSTPSPFVSPLCTPPVSTLDISSSASSLSPSTNEQEDSRMSSPGPSPSPKKSHNSFTSPRVHQLTNTEDEDFLENSVFSFQFPSPIPSIVGVAEAVGSLGNERFLDAVVEPLNSPGSMQLSEGGAVGSPAGTLGSQTLRSPSEEQESRNEAPVCRLELPRRPEQCSLTGRGWKSPLVCSLSDSYLGECFNRKGPTKDQKADVVREEGTMTSRLEMVDAAVQTVSPVSSWWDLKRNISASNMDSHSILGSPPGSRLNLKSSVGSNSNLVSPSSSMFPLSSGGDAERDGDEPTWDDDRASSRVLERRRSCLKMQGEETDEMGRRSSMKQVQWDEEGVTWDVQGASVDPEALSSAILKHLELQNSPQPPRKASKKKKAPKPPSLSNVVKAIAPELNPAVIIAPTCMAEVGGDATPEAEGAKEVDEDEGGKKEETAAVARRTSRAEEAHAKEDEEEIYGEEASHPKAHRKKSVIRSLKRTGWCGGSRKEDD